MKSQSFEKILTYLEINKTTANLFSLSLLVNSQNIVNLCKETPDNELYDVAILNYLTNVVVWLEQNFKLLFAVSVDKFNFGLNKFDKKLHSKLKVSEFYSFISSNFSTGRVMSELFNFQDLSEIDYVFSTLYGLEGSYFIHLDGQMSKAKEKMKDIDFSTIYKFDLMPENIYPVLHQLILFRHEFIHDAINIMNNKDKLTQVERLINQFSSSLLPLFFAQLSVLGKATNLSNIEVMVKLGSQD